MAVAKFLIAGAYFWTIPSSLILVSHQTIPIELEVSTTDQILRLPFQDLQKKYCQLSTILYLAIRRFYDLSSKSVQSFPNLGPELSLLALPQAQTFGNASSGSRGILPALLVILLQAIYGSAELG